MQSHPECPAVVFMVLTVQMEKGILVVTGFPTSPGVESASEQQRPWEMEERMAVAASINPIQPSLCRELCVGQSDGARQVDSSPGWRGGGRGGRQVDSSPGWSGGGREEADR